MSVLSEIIRYDSPEVAKQLAHLINIVKELGWNSLTDTRTIKPNIRRAFLYVKKHSKKKHFQELFDFHNISQKTFVDTINPLLIQMWHVQIIGYPNSASLELLLPISSTAVVSPELSTIGIDLTRPTFQIKAKESGMTK